MNTNELAEQILDAMGSRGIEGATMADALFVADAIASDLPRVDTVHDLVADLAKPTASEDGDLRRAYDRDAWAHEWNSLPTAIDRVLADHVERTAERLTREAS